MPTLTEIFNICEYISKGYFGLTFKFNYNNKNYIIKVNYNNDIINDNKFLNDNKIPKEYIYNDFDTEIKIYDLLNDIYGEDINNNKFQFCPKMHKYGIIKDNKIINIIIDKLKKLNINIDNLNNAKSLKYIIIDYFDNILFEKKLFDKSKCNNLDELHTYLFYIIYYLYIITKKYIIYNQDLHPNNILLTYDKEYEDNKIKYRRIKINNDIYKIKIYKYIPIIIDFGHCSIFNENIINQGLFINNNFSPIIKNNTININKKYNIFISFYTLFDIIVCFTKYNLLDNYIKYCNKYNLNKLSKIFNFKKDNINFINKYYKNNINDFIYIDKYIYNKILYKNLNITDNDLFKFIERFKE